MARFSRVPYRLVFHITQPAHAKLVTGTLADLTRTPTELLAENLLL